MDLLSLMQWPAMALSVLAAWLVGSKIERRRKWGFWWFLLSNVVWVAWAIPAHAYALIVLQVALAAMNIRGAIKAKREEGCPGIHQTFCPPRVLWALRGEQNVVRPKVTKRENPDSAFDFQARRAMVRLA